MKKPSFRCLAILLGLAIILSQLCACKVQSSDIERIPEKSSHHSDNNQSESLGGVSAIQPLPNISEVVNNNEFLNITTTIYNNGRNDEEGISVVVYHYNITDDIMTILDPIPHYGGFPVTFYDKDNDVLYYSNNNTDIYDPDNLYIKNLKTDKIKQLTYGKNAYDDLFMVDDMLIMNVAREYATVCQPAIYNPQNGAIRYYDAYDDDTWYYSLSYSKSENKLCAMTTSDVQMRSDYICQVSHIRPKYIYLMKPDFSNREMVFWTDQFEIRLARQWGEDCILMTYDKSMASAAPRKLKKLTISTGDVIDFDVPNIHEVSSFFPRDNKLGIYIMGYDYNRKFSLYYYDIPSKTTSCLFDKFKLHEDHRQLVDFTYYAN